MVLRLNADSGVPNSHTVMLMMGHGNEKKRVRPKPAVVRQPAEALS